MDMRLPCVIVFAVLLGLAFAQDSTFDSGVRVAMKIYDDCKKSTGFSPCLKKKAINFMDRLGKMEKLTIIDGINLVRDPQKKQEPVLTEDQLDASLPRALEAKDEALTTMVMDKVTNFLSSRSLDISVPRLIEDEEEDEDYDNYEARDGFGEGGGGGKKKGGGGGGGKKGGKKKGMMGHMMMMMMGKMVALIPIAIAGLFLLAGKALITAKIALLLSGIIALKKLVAAKNSGGGHGHEVHDVHVAHGHGGGGWQSGGGGGWQAGGGGGGGWQSGGGGGGWDKRSLNEAQNLAYNAYKQ